jgi:hypothetical protein
MLAPLDDPDVGVSVSSCRYPENAEMSLGGCLLNAVSPVQQCHEAADSGDAPAVSHLADAYRAELLADIGYFEDECLRSPGEAVELTLRVEDAGYAIVQAEHATVEYRASKSEASVRTAIGRAVDYGFSDAVLEARYGMRWINSGIFAAALLSLVLLPLAFLSMKAATAVSLAILVWGFFLGVQLPRIKWELPVAALNFAAWATVIWFIRDDWWPELFGREIHPSLVRQWCWFGAVTASYLLLVGKAALGSAWRTCRGRCGLRYALPVLALSPVWWLAAGVGYAHGRLVAPGGD